MDMSISKCRVFKHKGATIQITVGNTIPDGSRRIAARALIASHFPQYYCISRVADNTHARDAFSFYKSARRQLKLAAKGSTKYSVLITFPKVSKALQNARHFAGLSPLSEQHTKSYTDSYDLHAVIRDCYSIVNSRIKVIKQLRKEQRRVNEEYVRISRNNVVLGVLMIKGSSHYNTDRFHSRVRVAARPGEYLRAYQAYQARAVYEQKSPASIDRHVGIEIEFGAPVDKSKLGAELFNAGLSKYVTLKTDGSLRDFPAGYHAHELTVCAPASEYKSVLARALQVINSNGARVNKTCGLHVHLDMRNDNKDIAFSNLVSALPILYQMIPASRRDNTYCKRNKIKSFARVRGTDRYMGINPCSYSKFRTHEARLHSGTTDFAKISNFVEILMAVAYNPVKIVRGASTVAGFVKQHNITFMQSYIESRIRLFGGGTSQEETG